MKLFDRMAGMLISNREMKQTRTPSSIHDANHQYDAMNQFELGTYYNKEKIPRTRQQIYTMWELMQKDPQVAEALSLHATAALGGHETTVALMQGKASNSESTISAQVNADSMRLGSMWKLGFTLAQQHRDAILQHTLSPNMQAKYEVLAEKSLLQQSEIEANDTEDFMDFIEQYR